MERASLFFSSGFKAVFLSLSLSLSGSVLLMFSACIENISEPDNGQSAPVLLEMYFVNVNNGSDRNVASSGGTLQLCDIITGKPAEFNSETTLYKVILPAEDVPCVQVRAVPSAGARVAFTAGTGEAFVPMGGSYTKIVVTNKDQRTTGYTIFYDKEIPSGKTDTSTTAFLTDIVLSGGVKAGVMQNGLFDNGTRERIVVLPEEMAGKKFSVNAIPEYDGEVFYDKPQPMVLNNAGVTPLIITVAKSRKNSGTYRLLFYYTGSGLNENISVKGGYVGKLDVLYRNGEEITAHVVPAGAILGIPGADTRNPDYIINAVMPENGDIIFVGRGIEEAFALNINEKGKPFLSAPDETGRVPVGTYAELRLINTNLSGKYALTSNIDLFGAEWQPVGVCDIDTGGNIVSGKPFTGEFDGKGFYINNLRMNALASGARANGAFAGACGLFGMAGDGSAGGTVIKNLTVSGAIITSGPYAGGIAGILNKGLIQNCVNRVSIESSGGKIGGIAGAVLDGRIESSVNTARIMMTQHSFAGGIAGILEKGEITGCSNSGAVESSGTETGGITGCAQDALITRCENSGDIVGMGGRAGGLTGITNQTTISAGKNTGTVWSGKGQTGGIAGNVAGPTKITACYNTGAISGGESLNGPETGGIAGSVETDECYLSACYNTGLVDAKQPAMFVGRGTPRILSDCFYDGDADALLVGGDEAAGAAAGEAGDKAAAGAAGGAGGGSSYTDTVSGGGIFWFGAGGAVWPGLTAAAQPSAQAPAQAADWDIGSPAAHATTNSPSDLYKGKWWKDLGSHEANVYPRLWWE